MDRYIIIDLETSGLNSKFADIIEISALKIYNQDIIDSFSTLVNPGKDIDSHSTEINGITNEMVANAPCVVDVLPKFKSFIGDDCLVGYNISSFDLPILRRVFTENMSYAITNTYEDVLHLARRVLPELPNHKLCTVAEHFNISADGAHRALNDCYITWACYEELLKCSPATPAQKSRSKQRFQNIAISDVLPTRTNFDSSHPLYKKKCVFTGELQSFSKREAMQLIVDAGGVLKTSVSKYTDFLIAGKQERKNNNNSTKKIKAYLLQQNGSSIRIVEETEFLEMFRATENHEITSLFHGKPYVRFKTTSERDTFLKKYGLLSQNPRKEKIFLYKGRDVLYPTICDIVGYVQEYSSSATLAIDYGHGINFILSDFLKQMQLYTFSLSNLEDAK